ncbi:heparanase isoform X1 [Strongylocentrotus purpuratus]|uniref:Heparanase n=2 Tax=Strongylocentrotus purpuratus TaxID=7668 RepID=A0A7M7NVX6_STRPU|nr:heparanase isoform X1 [Strongylocentrotus purpuratus]XP_030841530.1 heparanase isoform X1 [Strongylocentrotus purpuratus]XP_030841531.1 heparanase isoform X1 [Strongylocentrotus purpuratus]
MTMDRGSLKMVVGRVTMATMSLVVMMMMMTMVMMGSNERAIVREPSKRHFFATDTYSLLGSHELHEGPPSVVLSVNTTTSVTTVDERFISIGATMGFIRTSRGQHFNSTRFWTLAHGLSPAIYRLGGAEADFTVFKEKINPVNCTLDPDSEGERQSGNYGKLTFFNMTLCAHTWDNINEFARSVGWDVLFTLNALDRNGSSWDPTGAIHLLKYTKQRGYPVLWALGNEPYGYPRKAHVNVTATQMADAYHTLRKSVSQIPELTDIFLVGPDTSSPIKNTSSIPSPSASYLNEFLQGVGNATNITSFHFYYASGRVAGFRELTDPRLADLLLLNIQSVQNSVKKYSANSKIWITESGVCFGSGPQDLNNVYVDGMLFLDKLGLSARLGVDLVVNQGLIGRTGGLFDESLNPHLYYWLLLYHKRLMGTRVLDVSKVVSTKVRTSREENAKNKPDDDFSNYIRIYAHCTKTSTLYQPGSVTFMIINMVPINDVHIHLEGALLDSPIHEYLFLPKGTKGILSPQVRLNGHPLKMDDDLTLPSYSPREQPPGSTIVVPQQSYGFYVLPRAQAPACQ